MALDSSLVRVGVTGGIYAGLGSSPTLPEDATSSPGSGLIEVGYVAEDGVTQTINADTTDVKAWQNGDVVRKIQTSHDVTFAFSMLETNDTSLEVYYGQKPSASGGIEIRGDQLPRMPWVIDVIDGIHRIRLAIPDAQVTERGDVQYVGTDAILYPITLTAFPDSDGVKAHLYQAEAALPPGD